MLSMEHGYRQSIDCLKVHLAFPEDLTVKMYSHFLRTSHNLGQYTSVDMAHFLQKDHR